MHYLGFFAGNPVLLATCMVLFQCASGTEPYVVDIDTKAQTSESELDQPFGAIHLHQIRAHWHPHEFTEFAVHPIPADPGDFRYSLDPLALSRKHPGWIQTRIILYESCQCLYAKRSPALIKSAKRRRSPFTASTSKDYDICKHLASTV